MVMFNFLGHNNCFRFPGHAFGVEISDGQYSDELKESMCVMSLLMLSNLYHLDFLFIVNSVLKPFLIPLNVEPC